MMEDHKGAKGKFDFYIGIDESNHGTPSSEIVVAVLSTDSYDVMETQLDKIRPCKLSDNVINGLGKLRRFDSEFIDEIVGRDRYRFSLIETQQLDAGSYNDLKLKSIDKLVRSFGTDLSRTMVIVDGEYPTCSAIGCKPETPHIEFIAHADTTYHVVNMADEIANLLLKYFRTTKFSPDSKKYALSEVKLEDAG